MIPTINKSTRITNTSSTLLNNLFTNNIHDCLLESGIIKTDITDHFPIFLITNNITDNHSALKSTIATDQMKIPCSYSIYPSDPVPPRLYGLIKAHKQDKSYPMRVVVSTIGTPCYGISNYLWNDEIHELENSGPIGLSFMVVLAESFLQYHEEKAIKMAMTMAPSTDIKSFYRYVDDSHARFSNLKQAEQFQTILSRQRPSLKYTIEVENKNKILHFLDITAIYNTHRKYEFKVYRKDAITNIQIKPHSNHDPKILKAIFNEYIHKAYSICSENHLKDEINFLIQVFTENGYDEIMLKDISYHVRKKRLANKNETLSNSNNLPTISLSWIPIISPRLRRIFRKAGYRTVFKSNANLKTLLTSRNKSKLPRNSQPETYLTKCICPKVYVGESKLQIRTRIQKHQKFLTEGKLNQSALALHKVNCDEDIEWE
ncbi:uncharacterized protein LOC136090028 [Hydra vulgaris]|uniref:Uncharacterized protein LOC136090028 n=1 Tax=Hydra vulgaris TaxID=6087 RepID=A0ABM4DCT4_HYDVU